MLIQVNEKNWIRSEDIIRIEIVAANQIGNPQIKFAVTCVIANDTFSQLFKTFEGAKLVAEQLAERINSEEW